MKIRRYNPPLAGLMAGPFALVRDPGLNFRLRTYYVSPAFRIVQLRDCGLEFIDAFALGDGTLLDAGKLQQSRDPWIYYLARKAG